MDIQQRKQHKRKKGKREGKGMSAGQGADNHSRVAGMAASKKAKRGETKGAKKTTAKRAMSTKEETKSDPHGAAQASESETKHKAEKMTLDEGEPLEDEGDGQTKHEAAKAQVQQSSEQDDSDDNDDDDDDDDDEGNDLQIEAEEGSMQTLNCDIRACCPSQDDFWGIKQLLHQLLRDGSFPYGDLADFLIEYDACSTVIKPSEEDAANTVHLTSKSKTGSRAGDDSKGRDDRYDVFGFAGVAPVTGVNPEKSLAKWLTKKCRSEKQLVAELQKPGTTFVICERIINLPPQLATAMYDTLLSDMAELPKIHQPQRIVMMFKAYEYLKQSRFASPSGLEFYGPEDNFFVQRAIATYRYEVPKTPGQLQDKTQPDKIYRVVCVLPVKAFRAAAQQVGAAFAAHYDVA